MIFSWKSYLVLQIQRAMTHVWEFLMALVTLGKLRSSIEWYCNQPNTLCQIRKVSGIDLYLIRIKSIRSSLSVFNNLSVPDSKPILSGCLVDLFSRLIILEKIFFYLFISNKYFFSSQLPIRISILIPCFGILEWKLR